MVKSEKDKVQTKRIEKAIAHIGAKVADAIEASQQATKLSAKSEMLLIDAQQELEALYISMDDESE